MASIVIPTWNEAAWLPRLLGSLTEQQGISEVIVADNKSVDATAAIAKSSGCLVLDGGSPARGRNRGARASSGNILIFADADVIVPAGAVDRVIRILTQTDAVAVHFPLLPITRRWFVRGCYSIMDLYFSVLTRMCLCQGVGSFLAVTRRAFEGVGGFRENILAGEDADFFRRVAKIGRVCYDRSFTVPVSPRRFHVESPLWYAVKTCLWAAFRLAGTTVSGIPYRWQPYPASIAASEELPRGRRKQQELQRGRP